MSPILAQLIREVDKLLDAARTGRKRSLEKLEELRKALPLSDQLAASLALETQDKQQPGDVRCRYCGNWTQHSGERCRRCNAIMDREVQTT